MSFNQWKNQVELAGAEMEKGKSKQARALLENALRMAERMGNVELRGESLTLLAFVSVELEDYKVAEHYQQRAVSIAKMAYGVRSREHAESLYHLADIHFRNKNLARAESIALECLDAQKEDKIDLYCTTCRTSHLAPYILLSEISLERGDKETACKWIREGAKVIYNMDLELADIEKMKTEDSIPSSNRISMQQAVPARIANTLDGCGIS